MKEHIFKGKEVSVIEKDFIGCKDSELKDRKVKIKRKIELFFKLIIVSIDQIDKFEKKKKKTKITPIKSAWYD